MLVASLLFFAAVEWEDPQVNSINRLPARTYSMPLAAEGDALTDEIEPRTPYALSLNGEWKFRWTGDPGLRPAEFWKPDFDDSDWYAIDVPSCVEMRGWGVPHYTNQKYPHADLSHPTNAAFAAIRDRTSGKADFNPVSSYRRTFTVPESWKGRRVILRFDGVAAAYYVWVNGHKVGYAEDSKLPSEFDVTDYLVAARPEVAPYRGVNVLAVEVYKWCDGSYLEDQDMTRFSGIFRDVTLWSMPKDGIWDFAVKASADGRLEVVADDVDWILYDLRSDGVLAVARGKGRGDGEDAVATQIANVRHWSAEAPYLYTLVLRKGSDIRMKRVGFRDVKVIGNTVLVNGRKVKFKGVNRHEASPENGRAITRADMLRDVELLKKYNFNMVRTAHYPDHRLWYDLCDRYGVYLMAEANVEAHEPGYGERGLGRFPEWEHSIGERNLRHVRFYRNHPSVMFWSMGNETGHGDVFRHAIAAVKELDPSRPVHWERGNVDADVDSAMYMTVDWLDRRGRYGDGLTNAFEKGYAEAQTAKKPFFMCEYSHAMGNAIGHFQEYWDVFYRYDSLVGGCVWDWIDQAVWKEPGHYLAYGGDFDEKPNDGNFNCNGVIGPERKVSAKLIEVGHVHRNLVVTRLADGSLELWNRFAFTFADEFDGEWELVEDGEVTRRGSFAVPHLAPLSKGLLMGLPDFEAKEGAETFLNINFTLKTDTPWAAKGWPVARNQVALRQCGNMKVWNCENAKMVKCDNARITEGDRTVTMEEGKTKAVFSRETGTLCELTMDGKTILRDPTRGIVAGPRLTWMRAFVDNDVWLFAESQWHEGWGLLIPSGLTQPRYHVRVLKVEGGSVRSVVEITGAKSAGFLHESVWTLEKDGVLRVENAVTPFGTMPPAIPRLGLSLRIDKSLDNVRWYGRGPRENYIDRCSGSFFGIWDSTVAGLEESYVRPQDNGFRSDVRWAAFADAEGRGVRFSAFEPMFVQAMRYGWEDIEFSRHRLGERRIRSRLVPDDWTNLNLDIRQLGLGSASCGNNPPLPQYRFPIQRTEWTLRIAPLAVTNETASVR